MQVIIFEDETTLRFRPLVHLKPVYGLVTGCMTLKERFEHFAAGNLDLSWHLRRHLAPWFSEQNPGAVINRLNEDDLMLVNGRLLCDSRVIQTILGGTLETGHALVQNGNLLFCHLDRAAYADGLPDMIDATSIAGSMQCMETSGFRTIDNIWDPVDLHPSQMKLDGSLIDTGRHEGDIHPSAVLVNPGNIYMAKGSVVMAGAVLDATDGYIHIGEGAVVEPQAVLMQTVFLAPEARVKIGAKIYSNVFIGRGSKAGGEIEDSIIEQFANKQHDGFLGHSYISSWCNLGAGTNTSDLKNNYSRVSLVVGESRFETGLQFLGLIMGEHAKCSISSMFNTGTVVGTAANIFGSGMPPKYVPSFSWGGAESGFAPYRTDSAVETARMVMQRRRIVMSHACEELFRFVAGIETAVKASV
jgi:UDP-N-acetylglucosamine diphosphorylase / glucose-1-phosphate thymidylyltransferase / UDP-N-acetylgalactosamine diphosphorylase / glucosamine-1-phosphate N-acetyltransferase / galactosamine-1-phosphate N-acetyltransferase